MRALIAQFARFGAVGAVGLVIDVALFNLLRIGPLSPELMSDGPIWAKVISTSVAIAANWIGNRYWTFRSHRGPQLLREGAAFAAVSVGGMSISVACLYISHYVLGFTSLIADNIASNVIGLALGSIFRFALYRTWVFRPARMANASPATPAILRRPVDTMSKSAPSASTVRRTATDQG